jgi:5-hydroxyisourate hydrolase
MSGITTHVLDLKTGLPARAVAVRLEIQGKGAGWTALGDRFTDDDGRVGDFIPEGARVDPGLYRLTFRTGDYFRAQGVAAFHPEVVVSFEITDAARHHHVPLLISPYGYTTYRGS